MLRRNFIREHIKYFIKDKLVEPRYYFGLPNPHTLMTSVKRGVGVISNEVLLDTMNKFNG